MSNELTTIKNMLPQTAGAQALVQRTLAEVQVAVMMAKQFPRDKIIAKEKLLNDCCREGLASAAMYSYARGGTEITGASIRLAEAAKNAWGNMQSGWRVLSRTAVNGVETSEVEAFAWDSENNTRESVTFSVRHWRDTKKGGYALTDERDIYELCANNASRRVRACILKMIDKDVIEDALQQCQLTLNNTVKITPEKIQEMVKRFEALGVSKKQIEKRVQRRVETINGILLHSLAKIYNSINDGMSAPSEWFEEELSTIDKINEEIKKSDVINDVSAQNIEASQAKIDDIIENSENGQDLADNVVNFSIAELVAMPQELASSQKAKAQAILKAVADGYDMQDIAEAMGDKWQALLDGLSRNGQGILKQKLIGA